MLFQPATYRSYPAISNSDLIEFERFLTATPNKTPVAAYAEGSAFHQMVLEPRCGRPIPADIDRERLTKMATAVRATRFGRWALQWGQKEQPHLFRDPETGLLCKCQTDLRLRHGLIVDIKTTRARTYQQFLECCELYQYDRQTAFYLDGLNAKRFVLLGVQKTAPFQVFYFEPTADATGNAFIEQGRERYKRLLALLAKSSFQPSSWATAAASTPRYRNAIIDNAIPNRVYV
ncbi:hypothetical protein EQG79_28495 [Spirosoma sordidisoli]|uniref:Putative exodeoxyribonuclease 8 PDDEXK-like domain-containing protein n=2 Tax=Cytophagia TaxID=768503 RepID=A0A4Q2UH62_9BACT|nr:hypothetical protein EQG79_28495 [Spirosoma sordidisoli]